MVMTGLLLETGRVARRLLLLGAVVERARQIEARWKGRTVPEWIHEVRRIVCGIAIQVDATAVPDGIPRQKSPIVLIIVTVRQQLKAGLVIRVVTKLRFVAERIAQAGAERAAMGTEEMI